jgi:hypothetical protein
MRKGTPWIIICSLSLYRWLLSLGPREFYDEYAEPTLQVFRQCCLDAYRERGPYGVLQLWPATGIDAAKGILSEHGSLCKRILRPHLLWPVVLTLSCVLFPFYWLSQAWLPFGQLFNLIFSTPQAFFLGHVALFCAAGLIALLFMPALRTHPQFYILCLMTGAFAEEVIQLLFHAHPGIHKDARNLLLDLAGVLLAYLLLRLWQQKQHTPSAGILE